jgi:hypothetical protein
MTCLCHFCDGREPAVARLELAAQKKIPVEERVFRLGIFDYRHRGGRVLKSQRESARDKFYGTWEHAIEWHAQGTLFDL